MNSLDKTAIVFLFSIFTVHCQDVVPETSAGNGGEENNQNADYNVYNVYDEDCIYIHDAEDKNTDGSNDNDRDLDLFECFIKKFNREYSHTNEYNNRFQIFKSNLKKIKSLQEKEKGTAKYGITKFSDLTGKEFREMYTGCNFTASSGAMQQIVIPDVNIPSEFDWRRLAAVTDVKDQAHCRSCWAFSAVGNIEGVWVIKHKKLVSLSAQELVDCDKRNTGCKGGYMTEAYKSIIELGGLQSEADYPYKGMDMECRFNKSKVVAKISGYLEFKPGVDEVAMAKWLFANAPMSIGINADAFKFYKGGVLHPDDCDPTYLNHGVVIVGYGVEESDKGDQPYWIIKNSWGSGWGEKGYLRLYRGDGTCGVNQMVSSAKAD